MKTIKDVALVTEINKFEKIENLQPIPINLECLEGKGTDKEGKEFDYHYFKSNDVEVRIPVPVLAQLRENLE